MESTNEPRASKPAVSPIAAPTGINLHPAPGPTVRISKRAGIAIMGMLALLMLGLAWGGYRRSLQNQATARQAGLPRTVTPAHADDQLLHGIPPADASVVHPQRGLIPPRDTSVGLAGALHAATPCGLDATGTPMRFNPQTGQPCDLPVERVVVRQAPPGMPHGSGAHLPATPLEDHAREAAWQLEHEAMLAPTTTRTGTALGASLKPAALTQLASSGDQTPDLAAIGKALGLGSNANPTSAAAVTETDYEAQNAQARKDAFLKAAQSKGAAEDYLRYTRDAPLSRFEIKAGWEIPAVLEQSLNSDLPGELKALVTSNVYDTASGQYLLIPQGSRLVGKYDSRISYGQDGVQVTWGRIIFPDASSVDLDGMMGLDSHGNAGLRDKVDHHYKRLIGMEVLTSMFMAAFAISQNRGQSILAYTTPSQAAETAVGQELTMTGAQMARRNMNVQPTIKVPAGYRFTVRVNRDILFEAPYEPARPQTEPQSQRSAFSASR
ncbi:MAG TPA: TrbI/VirB10 family protein [Bryobacteraceae bacterium]|jgi:type IV secretion system protein VirB10|nr:TrbI/VirB10 family protein [Bryobacteraceae bacterium]